MFFAGYDPEILALLEKFDYDYHIAKYLINFRYFLQNHTDSGDIEETFQLLEFDTVIEQKATQLKSAIIRKYQNMNMIPVLIGVHIRRGT